MTNTKEKKSKLIPKPLRLVGFILILVLIVGTLFAASLYKPTRTIYLHYANNESNSSLPRYECVNLKIISKEINNINMSKFLELDAESIFVAEEAEDLEKCGKGEGYFLQYPLKLFCEEEDCDAHGTICGSYNVEFYEHNLSENDFPIFMESYELLFQEKNVTDDRLEELFDGCEVR